MILWNGRQLLGDMRYRISPIVILLIFIFIFIFNVSFCTIFGIDYLKNSNYYNLNFFTSYFLCPGIANVPYSLWSLNRDMI